MKIRFNKNALVQMGRITVEFAALEHRLAVAIATLMLIRIAKDESDVESSMSLGELITAEMSFRVRVDTLGALFRYAIDDRLRCSDFDALLKRIVNAEEERNRVIHSLWWTSEIPGAMTRVKTTAKRKGFKKQEESVSLSEIKRVVRSITTAREELEACMGDLFVEKFLVEMLRKPQKTKTTFFGFQLFPSGSLINKN